MRDIRYPGYIRVRAGFLREGPRAQLERGRGWRAFAFAILACVCCVWCVWCVCVVWCVWSVCVVMAAYRLLYSVVGWRIQVSA